jgi:hypothetical protein
MRRWRRCRWCGTGSTASGKRPSGRSPRPLGVVPRLLGVTGLLAWQLAVAVPAQARAGDLDPGFGVGGSPNNSFGFGSDFGLARYLAG